MPHPQNIYSALDLFRKRKNIQIFHAVLNMMCIGQESSSKEQRAMRRTK
jgi:hypothetical protein